MKVTKTFNLAKFAAAILTVGFMIFGKIDGYVGSVILIGLCDIEFTRTYTK